MLESNSPREPSIFPTTQRIFGDRTQEFLSQSQDGAALFCEAYHGPLRKLAASCCRFYGIGPQFAEDATQSFFLDKIFKNKLLEQYTVRPGTPFRGYLISCFKNAFRDWYRKHQIARTGGIGDIAPLEANQTETTAESMPDLEFERDCAFELMELARQNLQRTYAKKSEKHAMLFDLLWSHILDEPNASCYRDIAQNLQTTEQVIKNSARELKLAYGASLREVIRASTPHVDIEAELRWILATVSKH